MRASKSGGPSDAPSDPTSDPFPISPRKRAANRANAARSTGPRTAEGKARSSMNAVGHGLLAQTALLPGEDPEELEALGREMEADQRPQGAVERELLGRVVGLMWRLRRAARAEETLWQRDDATAIHGAEAGKYIRQRFGGDLMMPWENTGEEPEPKTGPAFLADQFLQLNTSAIERLAIHEQRLDRALHAALRRLELVRKERADAPDDVATVQNEPTAYTAAHPGAPARTTQDAPDDRGKPPMASAEGAQVGEETRAGERALRPRMTSAALHGRGPDAVETPCEPTDVRNTAQQSATTSADILQNEPTARPARFSEPGSAAPGSAAPGSAAPAAPA